MLYVTVEKQTVTITPTLKVQGPQPAQSFIAERVRFIDPEGNHAPNWLSFLYHSLLSEGLQVEADEGDLNEADIPPKAVY